MGVLSLRNNGRKQNAIARQMNLTQEAVSKILWMNAKTGVPIAIARPGCHFTTTTRRQHRSLTRMRTGPSTKTASSLRTEWQNATNVPGQQTFACLESFEEDTPTRVQCARDHMNLQSAHWNQPANVPELRQAVMDVRTDIMVNTLRIFMDGMPHRLEALRTAHGAHTYY